MSDSTAMAIMVCAGFAFMAALAIFGKLPADRNKEIGIECVKSGGQWLSSWGSYECVREVKEP